jgi:hypothetical protein
MMRKTFLVSFFVLVRASGAFADDTVLDCGKKSLAEAVQNVTSKNAAISFTGVCVGPIVIATDGVTLKGVGTAIIDGGGSDAVTIQGASNVALSDLEVTNGLTGVVVRDGSHVALTGVNVHDNSRHGVLLQRTSNIVGSNIAVTHNGGVGLVADDVVSIKLTTATITNNTVRDLQLTFGAHADLLSLTFGTYTCDATVLVRGTSGIACPH